MKASSWRQFGSRYTDLDGLGVGSLSVALEEPDVALVQGLEVLLGLLVVIAGPTLVLAQVVLAHLRTRGGYFEVGWIIREENLCGFLTIFTFSRFDLRFSFELCFVMNILAWKFADSRTTTSADLAFSGWTANRGCEIVWGQVPLKSRCKSFTCQLRWLTGYQHSTIKKNITWKLKLKLLILLWFYLILLCPCQVDSNSKSNCRTVAPACRKAGSCLSSISRTWK